MRNSFCVQTKFWAFLGCWILGLLLGILAAAQADLSVVSLMRPGVFCRVSIMLLLLWCVLPLWFTAWSVTIDKLEILYILVFCRCFYFSFFLWLEVRALGSASWLILPLSRFSDWLSLGAFCWLTISCLEGRKAAFWIPLLITVLAVTVDFFLVSPFLAGL